MGILIECSKCGHWNSGNSTACKGSIRSGENLFKIIPQTVLVWTGTAPTDIPIDKEIINNINPKQKIENTFLFGFVNS